MKRRIPLAPAEGWLTLALVILMCMTMALAIDDARWVLGRPQYLDLLCGRRDRWRPGRLHRPEGRLGTLAHVSHRRDLRRLDRAAHHRPGRRSRTERRSTTSTRRPPTRSFGAYFDIAVLGLPSTIQYLHFIFIFGILVWGTSMFASYAVFGHHRPVNAVIVVGVVLLANMGLTASDELWFLVSVQPGGALPADPVPRLRRAVRMAAAADRRPGEHLVGLPARWDDLHRGRGGGLVPAHANGLIRAAGGRVRWRPGWSHRDLARGLALPADRWRHAGDRPAASGRTPRSRRNGTPTARRH